MKKSNTVNVVIGLQHGDHGKIGQRQKNSGKEFFNKTSTDSRLTPNRMNKENHNLGKL